MRSAVDSARESDDRDFCMMGPPMQERAFGGRLSLDILANRCWTAWLVSQTCRHPLHASGHGASAIILIARSELPPLPIRGTIPKIGLLVIAIGRRVPISPHRRGLLSGAEATKSRCT